MRASLLSCAAFGLGLAGCCSAPPSVPANQPRLEPRPAPASLTPDAKARYEEDRMRVDGNDDRYAFVDGKGNTVSENAFIRKYRDLTGSDELDDMLRPRTKRVALVSGVVLIVSVLVTAGSSIWCAAAKDQPQGCDAGIFLIPVGAVGTLASAANLVGALSDTDGRATDHYLSRAHAQLYAARYNEELIAAERAQKPQSRRAAPSRSGFAVRPVVGPTFFGVGGAF